MMKTAIKQQPMSGQTHETFKLTRRGKRAGALLGGSLAVSAFLGVVHAAAEGGGPEYTQEQLAHMPSEHVAAEPGNGSDALIDKVDPRALNGDQQNVRDALHKFIDAQAPGGIKVGQSLVVPIVPGEQNSHK